MSEIFKAYDIRGAYPDDLNEATAEKIGAAFPGLLAGSNIVLGRDMRLSSPALAEAFTKGALRSGATLTDLGRVTTPMLYYAIIDGQFDGGAMVTASHLPAGINGFKLCRENAIPFSGEHGLPQLKKCVEKQAASPPGRPEGTRKELDFLPRYIEKLAKYVRNPKKTKIVVDVGNGMAGPEVTALFHRFPQWQPVCLYLNPDGSFPHHVANPLIPQNTADLQKRVVEEKADLGAAFDGDADRCGFIDEQGNRIPEDLITALIAESFLEEHPNAAIVYDLRSSRIVPETIQRLGGKPIRSRVGHAFIKQRMRDENAVFAGELSGHYYYRDLGFIDNAVFTMIWMLNYLSTRTSPLSELIRPLQKYSGTGEINMRVKDKDAIFKGLQEVYNDGSIDHLDGLTVQYDAWWFNLRPSNTEPVIRLNLEAHNKDDMENRKNEVIKHIKEIEPSVQVLEGD